MKKCFTLEYWIDEDWYVGKLKEVPGVFSQGQTLDELEENIKDTYKLMLSDEDFIPVKDILKKEVEIHVWNEKSLLKDWNKLDVFLKDMVQTTIFI